MKQILPFLKPYRARLALMGVLYLCATMCSLLMPYLMSDIVNNGIACGDMRYIILRGVIMLLLSVAALLCGIWTTRVSADVSCGFSTSLQKGVFQKINSLTFEEFSTIGTSSLITRSTEDIFTLQDAANGLVYASVTVPVLFIGGAALAFSSDWLLALVLVLLAPAVILIVRLATRKMGALWDNSDKYIDLQNKIVRERLSGIRVIRAFDKEAYEHERAADATREMAKNIIKANVLAGLINPISILLLNLSTVLMLYVGAIRIRVEPLLKAGDVVAVIQYVALIMNGLLILSWTIAWIPHVKVCLRRVAEVLKLNGTEARAAEKERLSGNVVFDHVTFCYEGAETPALSDICMDVREGEVVAVIGGTGSGKSTIAKLLMDFHAPTAGRIFLGGRSYADITRETVRDNIAISLQKAMIFRGTIAENLRMGEPNASDETLERVTQIAQIHDFIMAQENGFDYELTQAGANLSGGQKQRISIARTIAKDASVYVFDDSFSALDYLTESKLRRELNAALSGKTQVIITQRAATAMRCDKIYVLDRGRIVGAGEHHDLMERCSIYREIYVSQLGEPGREGGERA